MQYRGLTPSEQGLVIASASGMEPRITVIHGEMCSSEEELVWDVIAIVTGFSAWLHGLRSHKNLLQAAVLRKDVRDDQGA